MDEEIKVLVFELLVYTIGCHAPLPVHYNMYLYNIGAYHWPTIRGDL